MRLGWGKLGGYRGFTFLLAAVLAMLNVLVALMLWGSLDQSRRATGQRARDQASNLVMLLAKQVDGTFEKTQLALLATKDEVEDSLRQHQLPDKAIPALLQRQKLRLPEVSLLCFADADGMVLYQTGKVFRDGFNVAGREYFSQQRDRSAEGFSYSPPFLSHASGNWSNVVALRVNRPDGRFYGVVFAAIYSEHLKEQFAHINLNSSGVASLRYRDMSLAARYPMRKEFSHLLGDSQLSPRFMAEKKAHPDQGVFYGNASWDGEPRMVAYQRTLIYPGFALVGVNEKDLLSDWRRECRIDFVFGGLFFILTALAGFMLDRSWCRQRRISQALKEEKQHFHIVADYVHDWEYWIDPEGALLYVSPSCERTTGYTAEEMRADPDLIHRLIHPDDQQRMREILESDFQDESEPCDFRIVRKDGEVRWLSYGCRSVFGKDGTNLGYRVNLRDVTDRVRVLDQLHELVRTDALTGLFNRRSFIDAASEEFERGRRYGTTASILFIDMDRFKAINDKFGHAAGDDALVLLSKLLREMIRLSDTAARWGGEEFLLLLPNTPLSGAREFAERVCAGAYNLVVPSAHGDVHITVSIGCAEFHSSDRAWTDTLSRADDALYHAKKKGRNRVILASMPEGS